MAVGRFAPSPTGTLHVGNLRTALAAWLFARSAGSRFLVRLDDLDATVARPELAAAQLEDLRAIGLDWDPPVVSQRDRLERYEAALADLESRGLTYPCYCTRREIAEAASAPNGPGRTGTTPDRPYPGTCRDLDEAARARRAARGRLPATRLRAEGQRIEIVDRVAGRWSGTVDDVVLRRNDGTPAYNLAVVLDDADTGVEEVVRGDDLLPSTPRQVLLGQLLGLARPRYAHLPMVLGVDGQRLAKRHGAVTLPDLAARGWTPGAVRSLLAWSLGLAEPGEPVSMSTLVARFRPEVLPGEPWVLDPDELRGPGGPGPDGPGPSGAPL